MWSQMSTKLSQSILRRERRRSFSLRRLITEAAFTTSHEAKASIPSALPHPGLWKFRAAFPGAAALLTGSADVFDRFGLLSFHGAIQRDNL